MVKSCSALGCTTRYERTSKIQFHRFPRNKTLHEKWIRQLGRKDWRPSKYSFLCSKHFTKDSYNSNADLKIPRLLTGAVPTIFDSMPGKSIKSVQKFPERRSVEAGQNDGRSKIDKTTGFHPHKSSYQQTAVDGKCRQDCPPKFHKSLEKDELSSGERTNEEALQSKESISVQQANQQCPDQCHILQLVKKIQKENKQLVKEIKTLQTKSRRRDKKIKSLRKMAGLENK